MVKVWASCVKWTNNNKIREHYQIQVLIHELYKELLAYKQNGWDINEFLAQFHILKEEAKVKDPEAYHLLKKAVDYKIYFHESLHLKHLDYNNVHENYK